MALKIGELLIQRRLITQQQLTKALEAQKHYGGKVGTNLVELGFVADTDLAKILAEQLQIPAAEIGEFENIAPSIIRLIPEDFAGKNKVIPLKLEQKLRIAICDPSTLPLLDELRFKVGKPLAPVIAPEIWVVAALERFYRIARDVRFIPADHQEDTFELEIVNIIAEVVDINRANQFTPAYNVKPKALVTPAEKPTAPPDAAEADAEVHNFSLADFGQQLLQATNPESVFNTLFGFLTPVFPQIALFTIKKDQLNGKLLSGFPVHLSNFVKVQAPVDAAALTKKVVESRTEYRGKLPQDPSHLAVFGTLGIAPIKSVGVYPLFFHDKVMGFVLGVPGNNLGPPIPEAGRLVTEAMARASKMLEILFIRRQITAEPSTVANR